MKINIELNRESIKDFFNDVYEDENDYIYEGAFPLKLDGKIYEHFFNVRVDMPNKKVKMTCLDVFSRYIGCCRCEDDDFEPNFGNEPQVEVELSEQEKMLFLVGCDAYVAGKHNAERN